MIALANLTHTRPGILGGLVFLIVLVALIALPGLALIHRR